MWRTFPTSIISYYLLVCYFLWSYDVVVICRFIYIYTCIYMQNESQGHNDKTDEWRLLYKNVYLSIYCKVRKGWVGFYCERELETEQNCNILTPTLMAVSVVSFSFSSAAQPEAQRPTAGLGDSFLYCILSATSLDPNSLGAPRVPSAWCGLSLATSYQQLISNCLTSVLTELYNSSMPTQFAYSIFGMACSNIIMRK